ncbi:MAG TPA: oxidoreductase [Clostridiales bacterium]|nr:MAG: oxidoreductase [Clostridiales bacterium GWD2_32_19]HCC07878.1 oxidoreductase [Clostridiales bacterium]
MEKFRIAVIGTGMAWDRLHLPALQQMNDKFEVVAMANRTEEKLKMAADKIGLEHSNIYTDYKEMLKRDDIDAVLTAVPIQLNFEVAKNVVKAGKNIIAEKPLAAEIEDAKKFLKFEEKYQVKVLIAENYRYNEEMNMIKNIINDGKIGEVVYFIYNKVSDFNEDMKQDTFAGKDWRQHPEFEGGTFLDGGIHDIAAMRHLFGKVDDVCSYGIPNNQDFCPYSYIDTTFRFDSSVIGHYIYWIKGKESQSPAVGLRIFGTNGMIYLENSNSGYINVFYNDGSHECIQYCTGKGYYNEWMNFYKVLSGEEKVSTKPDEAFGDMKLVMDILDKIKI